MLMKENCKKTELSEVALDGLMTIGQLESGLRIVDFECCEDVRLETFVGRFRVQGMRDGNLYMQELRKRIKNKPLFRQPNSTLTLGRDGYYYVSFRLCEQAVDQLPELLRKETGNIARWVKKELL